MAEKWRILEPFGSQIKQFEYRNASTEYDTFNTTIILTKGQKIIEVDPFKKIRTSLKMAKNEGRLVPFQAPNAPIQILNTSTDYYTFRVLIKYRKGQKTSR